MLKPRFLALAIVASLALIASAQAKNTAPAHAYFVNVQDGQTVSSPVKVVFGITGMKVAPAGVNVPNTGHFHLLIDTQMTDEEKHYAIAKDDQHVHFGKGQTETVLNLTPGNHTLQIVMGDGNHMLHSPPVMSKRITVHVKP